MINVSENAEKVLREYFKDKEISPIRIFLQAGGCGGPSLAMVLDEPKDEDDVYKVNGFTMVIDKNLHEQAGDVSVDYVDSGMRSGFTVTSTTPMGGGGSGCGGSCHC